MSTLDGWDIHVRYRLKLEITSCCVTFLLQYKYLTQIATNGKNQLKILFVHLKDNGLHYLTFCYYVCVLAKI